MLIEFRVLPPVQHTTAPRLSVSAAKTYLQCPRAYRLSKVDRVGPAESGNVWMDIGSLVHAVLEAYNREVIANRHHYQDGTVWFHQQLVERSERYPGFDKRQIGGLVRLLLRYQETVVRHLKPQAPEMEFLIEAIVVPNGPGKTPLRVYGLMDVVEPDGVWDYKVSGSALPPTGALAHADQLHVYAVAWRTITGDWPTRCGIIHLNRRTEEVKTALLKIDEKEVQKTIDNLSMVWQNIGAGRFAPRVGGHCSQCLFADERTCPDGHAYVKSQS